MDRAIEAECEALRKTLKEKGDTLISLVMSKDPKDRYLLRESYKSCFGVDFDEELNKNLNGNFRRVIRDLFKTPDERDATYLYKSMKGVGTDEDTLIEIICTRSNIELEKIKETYEKLFKGNLEKKVTSDTSGSLQKILTSLLQCKRSENSCPDEENCKKLAQELYNAGEKKLGTDEPIFNKIFALSSPPELFSINNHYNNISKVHLKDAISKEYSGHIKDALITILESTISPNDYYAKRVNKAVKGLGTNDKMLVRVLVSREDKDMGQIRNSYKTLFGKDMIEDIKDDTSGSYQKILVEIASRD